MASERMSFEPGIKRAVFRPRPAILGCMFAAAALAPSPIVAQEASVTIGDVRVMRTERRVLPDVPGGFTFCRLRYVQVRREQRGQGWRTDYPDADWNLTTRLSQLTTTPIAKWSDGRPGYLVISPTEPELFECPFLFSSDVGTAQFSAEEVANLRQFLLKGGFLWVDDFWGRRAWTHWVEQISGILPEFEIEDLPNDHPLFSIVYRVEEVPQIPSIQFWRESGGQTSELGPQSATPRIRAIRDESGRILVLMSHNTDIADGWEREGEEYAFFAQFSPDAYAIGINILTWMMTH